MLGLQKYINTHTHKMLWIYIHTHIYAYTYSVMCIYAYKWIIFITEINYSSITVTYRN